MSKQFNRILITGAAGSLGTQLRRGLAPLAETVRLADRVAIEDVQAHEEALVFDLADEAAAIAATRDVDAIVHMAAPQSSAPGRTCWIPPSAAPTTSTRAPGRTA